MYKRKLMNQFEQNQLGEEIQDLIKDKEALAKLMKEQGESSLGDSMDDSDYKSSRFVSESETMKSQKSGKL